ncbi:MAG: ubiquinone/menaquinone biosynthesis methyltransferase [Actinobacteria bacterium]|nr:ubiquinone/menaquinone biosynthesis methyltransferase [Actinomycetota bacterium]
MGRDGGREMTTEAPTPGRLPADEVRAMFNRIAGRYDVMNRAMTLGLDRRWRRAAAAVADVAAGDDVLDCCTGTADLAIELAHRVTASGSVTALDFAEAMLARARPKVDGLPIRLVQGDAQALPFPDGVFAAVTAAFGVRNLADLDLGLRELCRVVRPGGRVVVLEITSPRRLRWLYSTWFDRVVPRLGRALGRDGSAYRYLPASVRRFPEPPELARRLNDAGVIDVSWRTFAGGMVALHTGRARP